MPDYRETFILNDKVSPTLKKIVVNARAFDRKLGQTQAKMAKLQKRFDNIKKVGQGMQQAGGKITATVTKITAGVTALTGAFVFGLNKATDYADRIDKMSQKIGMSAEKYQELNFVLSQNGSNIDNLQMGYKTLTNQMAAANKGNKESVILFKKLGVSVKETNGELRSTDDVFEDSIKSLMRMKNPTERMAVAIKLFGRNAQELAPLLNGGIESYEKLKKVAREKVGILSKEEIANAVKYKDTMDKFSRMFETRISALAIKYMPKVTEYLDRIMSNTGLWDKVAVSLAKIISSVVKIIDWFVNLNGWQKKLVIGAGLLVAAIGPIITIIGSLMTAVAGLNTAITLLAANPVILTIAGWTTVFAGLAAGIWAVIQAIKAFKSHMDFINRMKINTINTNFNTEELQKLSTIKSSMGSQAFISRYGKDVAKAVNNYERNDNRSYQSNSNNTNTGNTYNTTNNYNSVMPFANMQYATNN